MVSCLVCGWWLVGCLSCFLVVVVCRVLSWLVVCVVVCGWVFVVFFGWLVVGGLVCGGGGMFVQRVPVRISVVMGGEEWRVLVICILRVGLFGLD